MDHLFHAGVNVPQLWFQNFSSDTWQGLATLCGVLVAVCLVKHILATVLFLFFNEISWRERKLNHSTCRRILYQMLAAIATMIDIALGYMLMLAFMLCNAWLCGTIILSSGLFYFLTAWTHDKVYSQLSEQLEDCATSADSSIAVVAGSSQAGAGGVMPVDLTKDYRKSVEADQLISMSTFQRNQIMEAEEAASADASTLLIRPDLLAQESENSKQYKARSDSDPLLDKYPVLRFHNVEVKDTTPVPDRKSKALDFDELDQLIKELGES